ncbi:hypothetical protein THERU_01855 [Thermocrinis ruber]|uniref:Uncharacterized protein n=1 Tax=Thermocrinis ruber TaxID=75906 RepID=W0DIS3_9AQUI|nr:hypothetical protein [Thermocrinis ruber]AHE96760.1 hypothetical protein THERU_01855 [Thermocrinis ruber]
MFVSLQFKLELKREDKEKLIKLMRKQSSAIRTVYNMLKVLPMELFPLKPMLVEGVWDRVRSRLVPLEAGGTVPTRDF